MVRRRHRDTIRFEVGGTEFHKLGTKRFDFRDPYYTAVTLSWPAFFASIMVIELVLNLFFATLYLLVPGAIGGARPGSLADALFFSLETLATVGYGVMSPASNYGHIVASIEIVIGLAFTAIVTGLIFVRFSKAKAHIHFAQRLVVAQHHGRPTLMLRLGYTRAGVLTGATAQLTVILQKHTAGGQASRETHVLQLLRPRMPILVLTWVLMHEIDASSAIAGMTTEDLKRADARFLLAVEAEDPALGARVHDLHVYAADQVLFGMAYKDVVSFDGSGPVRADLSRLDEVEPDRNAPPPRRGP